ncbi:MAG: hypothetical protein HY512_02625 [Candidatus Aenigmarchaeota archaeon]|nr:hypothetical protein [Candidatus Aenigmarchaeota archaeon]
MGYLNVARAFIGMPLTRVVSRHMDKDGYVWVRDKENFYFRITSYIEEQCPLDIDGVTSLQHLKTHVPTKNVPENIKLALENDDAGFPETLVERWSYTHKMTAEGKLVKVGD